MCDVEYDSRPTKSLGFQQPLLSMGFTEPPLFTKDFTLHNKVQPNSLNGRSQTGNAHGESLEVLSR